LAEASSTLVSSALINILESIPPKSIRIVPAKIPYRTPVIIPSHRPFLIRSGFPAPRFWLQNVETAVDIASKGHIANCFILIPAVKPETYTLPSPLLADCITMLPIAVTEYWSPIGTPIISILAVTFPFSLQSFFESFNIGNFFQIYIKHKILLHACAVIVAIAAPAHPHFKTIMHSKSRSMFNMVENTKNINGVLLSPTERSIPDQGTGLEGIYRNPGRYHLVWRVYVKLPGIIMHTLL